VLSSPLLDEYLTSQYKLQVSEAKRFGLTLLRHGPWGRDGPVNSMATLVADGTAG